MKHLILFFLAFTLFCCACNNVTEKNSESNVETKTSLNHFSDTIKMDTFKVVISGKKPRDMELRFSITAFNGKEIYYQILKARDLIDNYKETLDLSKEKSQRSFIQEEFNQFLDEENFLVPAVMENEEPNKQTPDPVFFKELKDTQLDGFKYRVSKETNIYIAWSAKDQKVKVYYKCC
jgi:hypothetical protein